MRRFSSLKGKNALRLKDNMGLSREGEGEGEGEGRGEREGEGEGGRGRGRGRERDVIMVFVCLKYFLSQVVESLQTVGGSDLH